MEALMERMPSLSTDYSTEFRQNVDRMACNKKSLGTTIKNDTLLMLS